MNHRKKLYLFMIVMFNTSMFIIGGIIILHGHQRDITLYDIPLYNSQGVYDNRDGNIFSTDYPQSDYWFLGRTDSLQPGIYNITVYYTTNEDDYTISCGSDIDGNSYPVIYAEPYLLSWTNYVFSYRIWINSEIDHLDVRIDCGGIGQNIFEKDSSFSLEKIEIARDYRTTVFYKALKLTAILLVCNGIFCVIWNKKKVQDNIYVILGLLCIYIISSLSIMGNFSAAGHDTAFHYARIVGLSEGLLSGSFPVKIQPGWLHGYGYATSVCYGDALLYFPAILYALGVPLVYTYKIYMLLVNLGTLLISYLCFRQIGKNKYIGIACSALYCLSISRILNLYLRAAVGEYSAFMFFPLILLGMQKIYAPDSEKESENSWLFLCLGMTGVIQTHVLSLEMVCIFIAISIILMIRKFSKQVFFALTKSVLMTLLLNIGFLLPFLDYAADDLQVFADRAFYGIQHFGLSIYELFSFGTSATGKASDLQSGPAGRIPESLGCAMLIMLLLSVITSVKYVDWEQQKKKQFTLAATLSGIALLMTTYYFPWNRLAAIPIVKNIVASIQFPWRFMSVAILLLSYMSCHVFMALKNMVDKRKLYGLLIGICMISAFQALFCMDLINRHAENYSITYDGRFNLNVSRIVSSGEYLLSDTDVNLTWTELDVMGENIQTDVLESKGTQMSVYCQAKENAWIEFPLFAYKYYRCIDMQTKEIYPVIRGRNNKIHIDLPDYYQGTLKVYFEEPWYWRGAEMISFVTLVLIMIYIRKVFARTWLC